MTKQIANRHRLATYAVLIAVALLILRIPVVQYAIADALIESTRIAEKTLRLPCALLDHDKCFSLDRFDPTCPQCM